MHDGQNVFNDSTSFQGISWRASETMNELIVEGGMREVIVVALYNTPNRNNEYTYSYSPTDGFGGLGAIYINWVIENVIPWTKSNLRIRPQRYGILGSSLGGLISCWAGWMHPQTFGLTGCMSSSFWWNAMDFNNSILVKNTPPNPPKFFYIDTGTDEGSSPAVQVAQTKAVAAHVAQLDSSFVVKTFYMYVFAY